MPTWVLHVFGNLGVLMVLAAYFLVSSGRLPARSVGYQGLNLAGGIILTAYSWLLFAWASVALNVIWAAIAVTSLIRNVWIPRRRGSTDHPNLGETHVQGT
ncbi:MAG: hypothetical protein KGP12_09055 [Actinomycetales bacterium]|nr:hypothetical protein [Actinomycetales bacterium]